MKNLLIKINEKIKPYQIDKYLFTNILQNLCTQLYTCYHHELKDILDKQKREQRFCEIVHTHCYNKTVTTKTAIKNTLKQLLTREQYKEFGLKLIYSILDVGVEITDDPYSPECAANILSQELSTMNVDPKLEAIAMKVMEKMNLSTKTNKYGNIIVVLMIIGIVLALIQIIQKCNDKKLLPFDIKNKTKFMHSEIKKICIGRNLLNTWRLRNIIKQKLNAEDYEAYGKQLRNAIMDTGTELTEEETFTLVEAANV